MWLRLILMLVTAAITACADEDEVPLDEDGGIAPLDPPPPNTQTPPDTPRNNFASCFSPAESFQLVLRGVGAYYYLPPPPGDEGQAATDPTNACGVIHIDREDICLAGEECDPEGLLGSPDGNVLRFRAMARWGDSAPLELYTEGPGDPGYGVMAARAQARADGSPLSELHRAGLEGGWGVVYPDFAQTLGFLWLIEGELDLETCRVTMILRGTVSTIDGVGASQDAVALPLDAERSDGLQCMAEKDYLNEIGVIHPGPMTISFARGTDALEHNPLLFCDSNEASAAPACEDVMGSANPSSLTIELIHDAPQPVDDDDDSADGGADAGAPGEADASDGGIPPLDPPDGDNGG